MSFRAEAGYAVEKKAAGFGPRIEDGAGVTLFADSSATVRPAGPAPIWQLLAGGGGRSGIGHPCLADSRRQMPPCGRWPPRARSWRYATPLAQSLLRAQRERTFRHGAGLVKLAGCSFDVAVLEQGEVAWDIVAERAGLCRVLQDNGCNAWLSRRAVGIPGDVCFAPVLRRAARPAAFPQAEAAASCGSCGRAGPSSVPTRAISSRLYEISYS